MSYEIDLSQLHYLFYNLNGLLKLYIFFSIFFLLFKYTFSHSTAVTWQPLNTYGDTPTWANSPLSHGSRWFLPRIQTVESIKRCITHCPMVVGSIIGLKSLSLFQIGLGQGKATHWSFSVMPDVFAVRSCKVVYHASKKCVVKFVHGSYWCPNR